MDVKEAINTARDYINSVFTDEEIMQRGLEGVMYSPDAGQGRITFSFVRPWDRQNTMAVNLGLKTPRSYKVVHIHDSDGKVAALTNRLLPEPQD